MKYGDSYKSIYEEALNITTDIVENCRKQPDIVEKLDLDVTLFQKNLDHPKFSTLLLATQIVNTEEIFAFAYWIPNFLLSTGNSLLNLLKRFSSHFGCEIMVDGIKDVFIEKAIVQLPGPLEQHFDFYKILGDAEIPCTYYCFVKEHFTKGLNTVDIRYCFSVNNNLYNLWFQDISTVEIKVPNGWLNRFTEISKSLNPHGKTKLTTYQPKNIQLKSDDEIKKILENDVFESTTVTVPKSYSKPFEWLIKTILSSENSEEVGTQTKLEKDPCVFCGSRNDSQEHIFSKWLRDYFPDKELGLQLNFNRYEDKPTKLFATGIQLKKTKLYGLVTYRVCVDCNTTWMSKMESQVKDILDNKNGQLINYKELLALKDAEKVLLSRWLCQKALLLILEMKLPTQLKKIWFDDIKNGRIPKDFLVECSDFEFYDFDFLGSIGASNVSGGVKVKTLDKETAYNLAEKFLKISFQIGNLFFRVSYFNEDSVLKRTSFIKKTTVLYPSNYDLEFVATPPQAEDPLGKLENKLKMHFIQLMGLMLDER